jgi:quercetin 2,3-dioxygenase
MPQRKKEQRVQTPAPPKTLLTVALVAVLAFILAFLFPFKPNFPKSLVKPSVIRTMSTSSDLKITRRPWNKRGFADHGWLYTFHTFSFASYYNSKYEGFGPLRVINEDRVEKGTGFGTHRHAEFLIWSYIVSGELEHKDSMGNLEKLRRGEVQFTRYVMPFRPWHFSRTITDLGFIYF